MGSDDEKDTDAHVPQDLDAPVQHPGVSTVRDDEPEIEEEKQSEEQHSRSSNDTITPVPVEKIPTKRSRSRASSAGSRVATVVPRSRRRGLLGRLSIIPEIERSYDYANKTKWLITLVVALAAAAAPLGSSIFYPALPQLAVDLHTTPTITNLSVALYMLSMSIFPLWWSSFSETLGRRTIYIISFMLFTLWNIIAAISTSIGMLIVMRILGGGAAASVQAVGAGTIADIWESKERGRAMGIFYLGPLLGPLCAPIIGGVLTDAWGWRSTQWFQTIYGGILLLVITFCLPETLSIETLPLRPQDDQSIRPQLSRISTQQSIQIKTKRIAFLFKRCIISPLSVLGHLRFPAVFLTVYLASITFGSLYVLNISVQQTFSKSPYDFSVIIVGLLYIPNSLGYIIASIFGGRWTDIIMHREARAAGRYDANGKLILQPEDRMRENVWLAAFIYPGALLWYGWTAQNGLHWILPMLANFFFGLGSMIIFGCSTTMLTEFLSRKSSSGVAVNNFVRNIFSCVGSIVAQPIIEAIGNGWIFTILACVCWVSAFGVVWAMKRFGPGWRVEMNRKLSV